MSKSLSVFPVHKAPTFGSTEESQIEQLNRVNHERNSSVAALGRIDATDFEKLATILRFYANPFYVESFTHQDVDSKIFDDHHDINSSLNQLPENSVSFRINELDGFDSENLDVLVFDDKGVKFKRSEFIARNMFGSFHVFIRKYNSESCFQQVFDNKPVTVVALNRATKEIVRPTQIVEPTDSEFVFERITHNRNVDPDYISLYARNNEIGSAEMDSYFRIPSESYSLSVNENGSIRVNLKNTLSSKTEFMFYDESDLLSIEFTAAPRTDLDKVLIANVDSYGLSLNPGNVTFSEDGGYRIPLYYIFNRKLTPVRPVLENEVLIFKHGLKLIPFEDFVIKDNGQNVQYLEINGRISNAEEDDIKIVILRPARENDLGLFYYGLSEVETDLEKRGIVTFDDKRMNITSKHSKWVFNDRHLVPLSSYEEIDNRAIHISDMVSPYNVEVIFDYVSNSETDLLLTRFMEVKDEFERFVSDSGVVGTDQELLDSFYHKFIHANEIGYSKYRVPEGEWREIVRLDKLAEEHLSVNTPLPLIDSAKSGYEPFFDSRPLDLIQKHEVVNALAVTIEHNLMHTEFNVVALNNSKRLVYFGSEQTNTTVTLTFETPFTGQVMISPEYLGEHHLKAGVISGLNEAESGSYVGTDVNGEFGIHLLPDMDSVVNPIPVKNPDIVKEFDPAMPIVVQLKGFNLVSNVVGGFQSTEIVIRRNHDDQVIFFGDFPYDREFGIPRMRFLDKLENETAYNVYARYKTTKGNVSDFVEVLKIQTPANSFQSIVPVVQHPLTGTSITRNGEIRMETPALPADNQLVSTRFQIALDPDFRMIVIDNDESRALMVNQLAYAKTTLPYSGLEPFTQYYIRVAFEQQRTGYSKWCDTLTVVTGSSLDGDLFRRFELDYFVDPVIATKEQFVIVVDGDVTNSETMTVTSVDMVKGEKILITPSSSIPTARTGYARYTHGSNIFIFGGRDKYGNLRDDFWKYSLITSKWTEIIPKENGLGPKNTAEAAIAVDVSKNRLYITGGYTNFGPSDEVYAYDFIQNEWLETDIKLPSARFGHLAEIVNRHLVIAGGKNYNSLVVHEDTHFLELSSGLWNEAVTTPAMIPGYGSTSFISEGDTVITFGGVDTNGNSDNYLLELPIDQTEGWKGISLGGTGHSGMTGSAIAYTGSKTVLLISHVDNEGNMRSDIYIFV